MPPRTCFVIMPIGDQKHDGGGVTASDMKLRYDDLIKEAILKADPSLEVTRADEVFEPGSITSDILTRIMHSDLVVADVTYPNSNVFYELGLRHASRPGTIIIKDRNGPTIPFDIAHLRYIEYENSPSGLKQLADKISRYVERFHESPSRPDNQFLELASLIGYRYPNYAKDGYDPEKAQIETILALIKSPEIMDLFVRQSSGEDIDGASLLQALAANPEVASTTIGYLVKSGTISLTDAAPKPKANGRNKSRPKKRR